MTGTHKPKPSSKNDAESINSGHNVCGIVMPISPMSDEYSAAHWMRVRKILETAVRKADFAPKVVWDNPELDVIQSKILQNIYDNEIIICDLSNLNPNVMLEAGLRLSTKKPTILVTDCVKKPPFDISSIEYISYQRDLEYNSIEVFINKLSERISSVSKSHREGSYKSFIDSYQFEIAKPSTIEVSSDKYIIDQINDLKSMFDKYIYTNAKNQTNYLEQNKDASNDFFKFEYDESLEDFEEFKDRFSNLGLQIMHYTQIDEKNITGIACLHCDTPLRKAKVRKLLINRGMTIF